MDTQTTAATGRTLTPSDRHAMLMALGRFAEQRPGLEPANYGDRRSYDNERRAILTDLQHARRLLHAVERRAGIGPDEILAACRSAYSGRLTLVERNGAWGVDYCTGQYWPTEYRRAVCAVLASALWAYLRDTSMPAPVAWKVRKYAGEDPTVTPRPVGLTEACETVQRLGGERVAYVVELYRPPGGRRGPLMRAGDYIRAYWRREFGRHLAARWFR